MKIVIDSTPLNQGHQHRGIGTYTLNLFRALRETDKQNEYRLEPVSNQTRADVIHYPFFDFFFLTLPLKKLAPTVVTIHDTIPLKYPDQYPPGIRGQIKFRLQKLSLLGVSAVITDSIASKKDIVRYLGLNPDKVTPIYLAAAKTYHQEKGAEAEEWLRQQGIINPYLLYVGDINYNKNLPRLIKVFERIQTPVHLVIISRAMAGNSTQAAEIRNLISHLKLSQRVIILSNIPSEPAKNINWLYSGAKWYIQPSIDEGFGLPVLEALACKTPVIVSRGGSLPEIIASTSLTFDPENETEIEKVIIKALNMTETERNENLNQALIFSQRFTWEQTARETIATYQKLT